MTTPSPIIQGPKSWYIAVILVLTLVVTVAVAAKKTDDPGVVVDLTVEERNWLDNHPEKLTLFFNTEFPPIEFISESGQFIGMGADIISGIEKLLDVHFIKTPSDDWNEHLSALKSGDCAIAPTIVQTAEREKYAFFTLPYATVPVVIITTRANRERMTLDDLKNRRVGVVSGYATQTYLKENSLQNHFDLISVGNVSEGLQWTALGQIDAFVENLAVAAYYIELDGIPNLRVAGKTDYAFAWRIGISREFPLLHSAISKALARIPENDLSDIRKQWISMDIDYQMTPNVRRNFILTALLAGLLLVSLTGFTILLTQRLKQKNTGLKESEEKYRNILNEMAEGYHEVDLAGNFTFFNDAFLTLFGYSKEEMTGTSFSRYAAEQSIAKKVYQTYNEIYKTGQPVHRSEWDIIRKDGQRRTLQYYAAVITDSKNIPMGFRGIVRDITESRQAEAEQEKLRAQLAQAQKMESVGRLAGGVAHDFNNMLSVIMGTAQLAKMKMEVSDPRHGDFEQIEQAAQRSAEVTRKLLAFARKQTISPRQLDLNDTVESMLNMLRRLIGEDIDLAWQPATHLWTIKMDPTQIDQILANLCVNARDAIDGVGKLTIETGSKTFDRQYCKQHAGFTPGDFVLLAVSDNGCGMDKDTLDNLFEPFFTTKEVGKGTGLGLATVYGIVKQNNGFINVYSEPGQGSTFKIYLPRLVDDTDAAAAVPEKKTAAGGTETILLVEDEPMILEMTTTMLQMLGYIVLAASSPGEAVRRAKDHTGPVHLLMTDVVMPEMNGRDLAEKITALYPGIRLLFMSGYTANVIAHQGILDHGVAFIQKPFSMADMTVKLREVLDETSGSTT